MDKNKGFEEGVTLDKILGGTYKKIDIFTPQCNADDLFPTAPFLNRRVTLQENFEIKEIEEEDEENYETRKEFYRALSRQDRGLGSLSLRVGPEVKSPLAEEKSFIPSSDFGIVSENSMQIPRKTLTNFYNKAKEETYDETPNITNRALRGGFNKRTSRRTVYSQSKSPAHLRKTGQNFNPTKGMKNVQVYPSMGSYRKSIEDIKNSFAEPVKREIMHKTFASPFYAKGEKDSLKNNELTINEASIIKSQLENQKVKSSKELDILEDKATTKKNRFIYQNSILQRKIKEEERLLLSKYQAKFDINIPERGYGKQTINPIAAAYEKKIGIEASKKGYTALLKDPNFGTFYKVGNRRGIFN